MSFLCVAVGGSNRLRLPMFLRTGPMARIRLPGSAWFRVDRV
ncbi:hypothetical protein [Pararhodobacter marinus]